MNRDKNPPARSQFLDTLEMFVCYCTDLPDERTKAPARLIFPSFARLSGIGLSIWPATLRR